MVIIYITITHDSVCNCNGKKPEQMERYFAIFVLFCINILYPYMEKFKIKNYTWLNSYNYTYLLLFLFYK